MKRLLLTLTLLSAHLLVTQQSPLPTHMGDNWSSEESSESGSHHESRSRESRHSSESSSESMSMGSHGSSSESRMDDLLSAVAR